MNDLEKAIRAIDLRFQSGNSISVDKALVTLKEWKNLTDALAALTACAAVKRRPLTDEEVDALTIGKNYPGTLDGARRFARAIEREHGIGSSKECG